jgi:hypothetical protein
MNFCKRNAAYIIGTGLAYVGAFVFNLIPVDINWSARCVWAFVLGSLNWLVIILPLIALQWLIGRLIRNWSGISVSKQVFIVNFPIVIVIACVLALQCLANSPRKMFERLVMNPVPKSVSDIQMKGTRRMDSALWVFHFRITPAELIDLMSRQHLTPVAELENPFLLNELVQSHAGFPIDVTAAWQVKCVLKAGGVEKYVLFNTNNSEAVFILNTH